MAIAWPASLTDALSRDGWDEALPDMVISSPVAKGPPKVRRATTAAVRPLSFKLEPLTVTQANALDTFYVTTTAGGAVPFDFVHPRLGAVALQFKPGSPPKILPLSGLWYTASLTLLILP